MRMAGRVSGQAMQVVLKDIEHNPLQNRAHVRRGAACGTGVELLDMREQTDQPGR